MSSKPSLAKAIHDSIFHPAPAFQVGQAVKFRHPLDAAERTERFEVLEVRGDCALVRSTVHCLDWMIRPTASYLVADLIPA